MHNVNRGTRAGRRLAGLVLTLAASAVAAAPLEEIVVRGQQSLSEDFSAVGNLSRIDEQTLALIGSVHPNQAFERVPGVWVSRGSGQEHLTAIRSAVLTGSGACGSFLFLENGIPVRPSGFCNVNGLFEVNVEQARGIEVVRGPASALYGGNALFGVINVLSPAPRGESGGSLRLEGGPWDFLRADADAEFAVGEGRMRITFTGTTADGWRDDTGYDQQKLNVAWDAELAGWQTRTVLSAVNLNQETGGYVLGTNAYEDNALRDTNPNPEAFRDLWALRLSTEFSRLTDAGGEVVITPYLRANDMDFLQHFLPGQPLEENGHGSGGVLARFRQSGDRLTWSVGTQIEYADTWLEEFQAEPATGSAFLQATRPVGQHYDYEATSWMGALFYDLSYRATDALTLVHSLRAETIRYDYENNMLVGNTRDDGTPCGFGGCLYTRPADRDDSFDNVAGRIGAEYAFSETLSAYVTAGIGFRPPQITELYRLRSGQQVTDLDSESLRSVELGGAWTLPRGSVNLALFAQRNDDVIFRDASGFNRSDGETESVGAEFELYFAPNATHEFDLIGTWAEHEYAYSSAIGGFETITEGDAVDTAPKWQLAGHWRMNFGADLQAELEALFMDEYYTNADNTADYPGHMLWNLRLLWTPLPNTELGLRVLNLTDAQYAERADFAFGNDRYFPGEPRRAFVSARYRF